MCFFLYVPIIYTSILILLKHTSGENCMVDRWNTYNWNTNEWQL